MTESFAEKTCTPCRGGVPPLPRDTALRFQAQASIEQSFGTILVTVTPEECNNYFRHAG